MSLSLSMLSEGDWVVHRQYGIGQIKEREQRSISGRTAEYYKVKTPDSIIWLPVEKIDNSWFRPIASPTEIDEAICILSQPATNMDPNFMSRKERIQQVQSENSVPAIAKLIRDLWGRQQHKSLSMTEQRALRRLKERLATEWAVAVDKEQAIILDELQTLLEKNRFPPMQ